MTTDKKVARPKLSLPELATELKMCPGPAG